MRVSVNGENQEFAEGVSVAGMLSQLGLTDRRVAVEVNRQIVRRSVHGSCKLKDGDVVEIVSLVGGG